MPKIDRDSVLLLGGHVLAARLASAGDLSQVSDAYLNDLADVAVRASLALDAAIPRAAESFEAEASATRLKHAAERAESAAVKLEDAAERAASKAADKATARLKSVRSARTTRKRVA